jgi:hypothetical protein
MTHRSLSAAVRCFPRNRTALVPVLWILSLVMIIVTPACSPGRNEEPIRVGNQRERFRQQAVPTAPSSEAATRPAKSGNPK